MTRTLSRQCHHWTFLSVAAGVVAASFIIRHKRKKNQWHAIELSPIYVETPRFEPGDPGLLKHLKEHGFAVARAVLSPGECSNALSLLWDWLEGCSRDGASPPGLDRNDPSTWGQWPASVEGGILPYFGAGQSAAAWFVRGKPRVHEAFAGIWGTGTLVSSFDAVSVWRPWQISFQGLGLSPLQWVGTLVEAWRRRRWRTEKGWFHIDQNPLLKQVRKQRRALFFLS